MAKKGQYTYEYPHPAVTADCVVFGYDGKELRVLLIKRGAEKEASTTAYVGEWALPGGFLDVEQDKTIAHTAQRELKEETGLKLGIKDFKEAATFSDIKRDPRERVITIAHYALVKLSEVQADTDADKADWFSLSNIPHLAFDHDKILRVAFSRMKQDIHFEPVGFELLPEVFTLPQLQHLYESILEVKFDRRNFANKMKHFGMLSEVSIDTPRHGTRTPIKYRFNKENYERLKSNGFQLEF
ncbi:MAG: NUDIX domain-containing protein [Candidatus Cryptobacteroides sp.]|nr:NUDIX domain-containing protein [Candidatus Cryptobacteroides sp.]